MTTTAIEQAEAIDLLVKTAEHNSTGRIGSPYTVQGYTADAATNLVRRCRSLRIETINGFTTMYGLLPEHGWHSWYIITTKPQVNPWT